MEQEVMEMENEDGKGGMMGRVGLVWVWFGYE
jgi:hypothetical protein